MGWLVFPVAVLGLLIVGSIYTVKAHNKARSQIARYADLVVETESLRIQNQRLRVLETELKELRDLQTRMLRLAGIETALGVDLESMEMLRTAIDDSLGSVTGGFIWPVDGGLMADLTQEHGGIDIEVPRHRAVLASGSGLVTEEGEDPQLGYRLMIAHPGSLQTVYANLELNLVQEGDSVSVGQIIGLVGVGREGRLPHLHFEVRRNGMSIPPGDILPPLAGP